MIIDSARALIRWGVLGMNRRNAEYIMRFNPRSLFPLVDNKVFTKRLARDHRIPTPMVYTVIESHGSIRGMEASIEGKREFVVKPARGSGGSGIILITDRKGNAFVTKSGEEMTKEELSYRISDILSGIYSLGGLEDSAIVEALIHPDDVFALVSYQGVPDVRVIVYKGVPVMSMVRLPTRESDGKANLHQGAIGAGIDLATGVTLSAVYKGAIVEKHPDTGNPVRGITVPYWGEILHIAAKSLEMTGLEYVGADLVLDKDVGPVLLELNARPGLAIQMANMSGLKSRVEAVEKAGAEIPRSPEDRVAWARANLGARN